MELEQIYTKEQSNVEQARFLSNVYGWMTFALLITGYVASWVSKTPSILELIIGNSLVFYGLLIAEILCVVYLVTIIDKISSLSATLIFVGYSIMNGLTLSVIFLVYTSESISSTFYITAGTFAVMSIYGFYTKKDLTSIGNLAFMGLIGVIIASIVNLIIQNEIIYWITTYLGVLIFIGLIAYDTQKIKNLNVAGLASSEENKKGAIIGALTLYLDFINLFLYLLRLFGKRR